MTKVGKCVHVCIVNAATQQIFGHTVLSLSFNVFNIRIKNYTNMPM